MVSSKFGPDAAIGSPLAGPRARSRQFGFERKHVGNMSTYDRIQHTAGPDPVVSMYVAVVELY